jgi:hypothetical protein
MASGTVLGLTGAVIGRAAGATIGRVIDQRLLGSGSEAVAVGRVDRFRITGAVEGAPMAQVFGRMRLGGQIIWATQFVEKTSTSGGGGGGKGAPLRPQTTSYSYCVSLAVALCEGEIARVGRIWADGIEMDREMLSYRVYRGTADQMPDPLLEAVEGVGAVPPFRGTAYVVFENLDLSAFGNRVPQFAFEVFRRAAPAHPLVPAASEAVTAVALMPGTGEYALATSAVQFGNRFGSFAAANVTAEGGKPDLPAALEALRGDVPNLQSVSLIYSWFGDDLRAGSCRVKPKVEARDRDGIGMPWTAGGISRAEAEEIARIDDRPVYGGTPTDQSVIEAIRAISEGGQAVTFYPFLLMEILAGNTRPDPWSDSGAQPPLPWRGRITGQKAPGLPGSPDGTAANGVAVTTFFGNVTAADFNVSDGAVSYSGPAEWSYSRFILHGAAVCAAAGGVEAFCIGSEMRGLTQMRDDAGFPAVARLRALAAEVRALLPDVKLSYAADWSEYFGYHPQDGSGDVYFHLDPLWGDDAIDFVAIDNYMPLSDWRDGTEHADAGWGSIHDLDYLKANVAGGEGYDWYYPTTEARDAQRREPIADGAYGQDWVFRYKDLRRWWSEPHLERRDGVQLADLGSLNGREFDGVFAAGDAGWAGGIALSEAELSSDPPPTQYYPDLSVLAVAGEGNVLNADQASLTISDRVLRSFVRDQEIRLVLRTRVLSVPADGQPHRCRALLAAMGDDGAAAGAVQLAEWTGTGVANGWVEYEVSFRPADLVGAGIIPVDAKGWRLAIVANAVAGGSPAGAVQQIASVSITVVNGVSPWVPQSKPIWFTEIGCAAIDKGTNQPNTFLDPKSSENAIPHYSTGRRDDLIQQQYLRAITSYWAEPANNPVSALYEAPMLDMARAHVWAWDARPWPAFPNDRETWSDGANWARGHWITGRITAVPLGHVVAEICERAGVTAFDVSALQGLVRGHVSGDTKSARAQLQPLMLAYGFQAVERDGLLVFLPLSLLPEGVVMADLTALNEEGAGGIRHIRAPEAETVGRVRLSYTEADAGYEQRVSEAVFADDPVDTVSQSHLPLVLTGAEGQGIVERWLAEARVARDTITLSLPPSRRALGAGAMIALADGSTWRIDRVEDRGVRHIEALRVEPTVAEPSDAVDGPVQATPFVPPLPVSPVFMDLPLLTGQEVPHAPHVAIAADPWPGAAAVYASASLDGFVLNTLVDQPAIAGILQAPLFRAQAGLWDRGGPLRVQITGGALSSADRAAVLNGANLAAIGMGDDGPWEVIQFAEAVLVGPNLWEIGARLRGQGGTDAIMPDVWPEGSIIVLLTRAATQITLPQSARGLARNYRIGPARRSVDDPSYVARELAFAGVGLRPYSPAHLRARWGVGGHDIGWIRRTRIDGDSWQGGDVPLGEASEQYLLRISDAGGIRREESLGVPSYSYGDGARMADGVTGAFTIEVAQVSDGFGPGPFARIEIND